MKKTTKEKILMYSIMFLLFVGGSVILTYGDTNRYDGKLSGDEVLGIVFIVTCLLVPLMVSATYTGKK